VSELIKEMILYNEELKISIWMACKEKYLSFVEEALAAQHILIVVGVVTLYEWSDIKEARVESERNENMWNNDTTVPISSFLLDAPVQLVALVK
jgi:hypothetical protein